MRVAAPAQRQQHDFDVDRRKAGGRAGPADQEWLRLVGQRGDDRGDFGAVGLAPQADEPLAAQLAQEQRAGAAADDPQRKAAAPG